MASMFARAQVSLDRDGLIPEDVATNTWYFDGDWESAIEDRRERWDTDVVGLVSRLVTFYQTIQGQLSATLAGTGTIRVYDMHDARERIPRVVQTFAFTPGDNALPGEVAVCLSFKAVDEPGAVRARRRGRVYIGPLSSGVVIVTGADARYNNTNALNLLTAAEVMAIGGAGAFRLSIYSPTSDAAGLGVDEAAYTDAETLWVDNAFDIQRRRGADATVRQQVTITG